MGGFKKFPLRGNVVDLAVWQRGGSCGLAVVIGGARCARDCVHRRAGWCRDRRAGDFSEVFTAAGVTFPYGVFVQSLISFLIVAAVVYFLVVKPVQRLMDQFRTEPE